ncbi:MAG: UDP-glucose 4-epimerase [Saprospiraceae bacterium]|jgi:UDP-glucose 4-epimerase
MAKVLVTGGSGYIGSHTLVNLMEAGYQVISIDNHINSKPEAIEAVKELTGKEVRNYEIDLCDAAAVSQVFQEHSDIDAVIHFAALKAVGESVEKPMLYFKNNMNSLLNVMDEVKKHDIQNFIFSSSCTVYGQATDLPVTEETEMKDAESPYGRTKQLGEYVLRDLAKIWGINVVSLRYFNPAGAHPSGKIGEAPKVIALNLVPIITETAAGKREKCMVFGDDYNTRDGSCVRDYIHIQDLATAHTKAVDYLIANKNDDNYEVYNLGIGQGVTVIEAIKAFEKVSGKKLNYEIGPRRPGDVVAIYSNYEKARQRLDWEPQYGIDDIMRTSWEWELHRPY